MPWGDDDDTVYMVVINHEEHYSIWPVEREIPNGWKDVGKRSTKKECLEYIEEVWTDMRPLSLRSSVADFFEQKVKRDAANQKR